LFPASKDAVVEAVLLMILAPLETVIGLRVAAKLLNMPVSELALSVAAIRRRFARANEILSLSICTNGFTT
jgi:hypothetical protein